MNSKRIRSDNGKSERTARISPCAKAERNRQRPHQGRHGSLVAAADTDTGAGGFPFGFSGAFPLQDRVDSMTTDKRRILEAPFIT